jgi:L-fucose isomerase-like protein
MMNQKKLKPCIGVASLSSPLEVGAEKAPQAAKNLADKLRKLGCDVVDIGSIDNPAKASAAGKKLAQMHVHGVVFGAVSWFEDYLVLDLLEECKVPILLWSFPGMETGALCGTQQLTAYLKQLGCTYNCVYADIEDSAAAETLKSWTLAAALKKRLRVSKIGGTGHRVAGMTEVAVNEMRLKKAIGPRVVYVELAKIFDKVKSLQNSDVKYKWFDLVNKSASCTVSQEAGFEAIKIYLALKDLINEHNLDALAFGCYPDWMGCACIASSLLADEGIPIGCEGDINATVGQLMLTLLTEQPTHNTDWLEPLEDGTVILTHCGSGSLSLAENPENITLSSVRLMGQGVCALFPAKPGIVTLLSILPCGDSYQIAMLTGEALPTKMVFPGNPLRVRFERPVSDIIDWIHIEGIGHHWVAGYGDVSTEIRTWATMVGKDVKLLRL